MSADRKPLAAVQMQKRHPHTIHFSDSEWEAIREVGRPRLLEPSVFVRSATMRTVRMLRAQSQEEASFGMLEGWR